MLIFDKEKNRPHEAAADFVSRYWAPAGGAADGLTWEVLAGDGSDRSFVRVRAGRESVVMVHGPDPAENRSYEMIGRHLWAIGRLGPEFLAADRDFFLIEDLGSVSLQDYVESTDEIYTRAMYEKVLGTLVEFHERGLADFDPAWCYDTPRYDRSMILKRETGYFLTAFVRGYMELDVSSTDLAVEFEGLARAALDGTQVVLMHRDFQSRNIMIKQGRPRLIDFQGARPGPPGYDLASLLGDPYVVLSPWLKGRLFNFYLKRRRAYGGFDQKAFLRAYPFLAASRLLQALGAYGFLSRQKGKTWFEDFIPGALRSLDGLLAGDEFEAMPVLRGLVRRIRTKMEAVT